MRLVARLQIRAAASWQNVDNVRTGHTHPIYILKNKKGVATLKEVDFKREKQ